MALRWWCRRDERHCSPEPQLPVISEDYSRKKKRSNIVVEVFSIVLHRISLPNLNFYSLWEPLVLYHSAWVAQSEEHIAFWTFVYYKLRFQDGTSPICTTCIPYFALKATSKGACERKDDPSPAIKRATVYSMHLIVPDDAWNHALLGLQGTFAGQVAPLHIFTLSSYRVDTCLIVWVWICPWIRLDGQLCVYLYKCCSNVSAYECISLNVWKCEAFSSAWGTRKREGREVALVLFYLQGGDKSTNFAYESILSFEK